MHRRRKWAGRPFGPPSPKTSRPARTIPGLAQSIAMIVATPELIATERVTNARVGQALRSILLHGYMTLGMCRVEPGGRVAGWPGGSDAHDLMEKQKYQKIPPKLLLTY